MKYLAFGAVALSLAACATNQPGWTGNGAMPFDSALATCQDQVVNIPVEAERNAALESCMQGKGWTRTGG